MVVLDGNPLPLPRKKGGVAPPPNKFFFLPIFIADKRQDGSRWGWMEVGLIPGDFMLDGDPPPHQKGGVAPTPQFSAQFYCGQTARCIRMALGMELYIPVPGTAAIRRRCQSMKPQVEDRRQVDEPLTRRRLRSVPPPRPLRPLTRRLNAFCSIASTYFCARSCFLGVAVIASTLKFLVALIFGRPFVKRFALCYRYVVRYCPVLSVCLSVLSVYL